MNLLFDIGHPAHVHLFRNFIHYLKGNGHHITVVTRQKDITNVLLDYYQIPYLCISKPGSGLLGMSLELLERDVKILQLYQAHPFDASFGTSVSIGHFTFLKGTKSYSFNEDDDDIVPLYALISYPFCTKIIMEHPLFYQTIQHK